MNAEILTLGKLEKEAQDCAHAVQQTRWWPTLTAGATKAQDSKSHSNCMVSLGSSVQENTLVLLLRLIVEKNRKSYGLSNNAIFNDLERPHTQMSRSRHI